MMTTPIDPRVEAYLRQLDYALSSLPWEQRNEILADISEHIERELATSGGSPEAVDDVLRRVGDPHAIAQEAGAFPAVPPPRQGRGLEIAAVILISIGSFVIPLLGWIVGVVLLWVSRRFTRADKLIGTLFPPLGFFAPLALAILPLSTSSTFCSAPVRVGSGPVSAGGDSQIQVVNAAVEQCSTVSHGLPAAAGIAIVGVLLVAAIYTVVRLTRRIARMT